MSDAHVRQSALEIDRHVLLQAPAGSGKTTVLAQRFLHALAAVDEPEQVLAITFTRKAAAEMRERVLLALEEGIAADHPDHATWSAARAAVWATAERRAWDPVELAQRLRIQTIDSLAHEVARTLPLLGRLQTSLEVVDDATSLYQDAARLALREGETEPALSADIDRLLRRLDNNVDQAQQLLASRLAVRNRWLPWLVEHRDDALAERVAASIERIVASALRETSAAMPGTWWHEAAAIAAAAARNLQAAGRQDGKPWHAWLDSDVSLTPDATLLPRWQAIADLLLTDKDLPRKTVTVTQGFPPDDKALKNSWSDWMEAAARQPAVLAHLRTVRNLPPAHLDTDERAALASLARVLLHAASQLKLVFRDAGCVDHSEIAAVARQALNAATGLGEDTLRHTARVTHLLIDEFQDISPEQLELVQAITSGWAEGDGHSLFCVGDPMQSIYLFRDAEVGLFLQVRANGVGDIRLEPLQLTRNFRSQQALVEWSNQAFRQIFPPVENLRSSAVTFLAAQVARATDVRLSAEVRILAQADDDAVAEARHIARELMELREKSPELRVAVLVQSRALAGPILRALRDRGMPVLGVDLASLAERPVVRDLVALGQALLDSGDRTAWLAVLRAPTCGLLLADLLVLAEAEGPGPLVERLDRPDVLVGLSADALARLRRAGPVLQAAWRARGSRGIAENIEQCWLQLGGSAACSDAAELDVARQFLLALRNLEEREGPLAPRRLAALADRLLDRGHAVGANPVEVLTIHAAKGLEWDVVFVPGLGRGTRRDDAPLLYSLELPGSRGSDLLLAVRSLGRPNTSDPLARYIRFLQSERQDNERLRLLYVAATRARLRLYLSGHAPQDRNGQARPRSGSLLQRLWPAVAHEFAGLAPGRAQPAADGAALPMLWKRLPADFQPPQAPCLPDFDSLTRAQADDDESWIEFAWVGPLARAAGTVMHAELERLARMGEAAVSELASRTHACATGLRELGIPADLAASTASQIIARLAQLVREDTARWLLFAAHRTDASELRLSGMVDGELRNVVIDRSFVAADGTRWIVDYKTGVHHGSGLEEFVARELTRYAPQLRLYAALASRLGPEPVRAALYFPWLGEFRELQSATST